jgi:hypothetical protein
MKGNSGHYYVLCEYFMNHASCYGIQALGLRADIVREVSVYVHGLWDLLTFYPQSVLLIRLMLMIDSFLSLVVIVPNRVSHGCDYDLTGPQKMSSLRVIVVIA